LTRLARALIAVDDADPGILSEVAISDPAAHPAAEAIAVQYARLTREAKS
jgi:hypothetical protein